VLKQKGRTPEEARAALLPVLDEELTLMEQQEAPEPAYFHTLERLCDVVAKPECSTSNGSNLLNQYGSERYTMPRNYSFETYCLKRELVKNYHRRGFSIPRMIENLDRNGLFSAAQSYGARYSSVLRVLHSIKKEDAQRFHALRDDAECALHEYIARQEYLYMKAVENGNYELAAKLSKDIARGHGVVTEEPVRVETDILVQMGQAFAMAEKKMLERKQRAALSSPVPALDIVPSLVGNGKKE
jgi:hypothetical protein